MSSGRSSKAQRPRELRRRVVVPARLRHGVSWTDTCILNISSRGMMIHTSRPLSRGHAVEIRRGDHIIVARVVWRDGGRAGLKSDERVPVETIMTFSHSTALELSPIQGERRKQQRVEDASRLRGRAIEFAGAVVIAASLAGAALSMVEAAFARPLAVAEAALVR